MRFITLVNGCLQLLGITGIDVSYDNSTSGLTALNAQAAIDELAASGVSVDACIDGGFANSIYTPEQCFDGGGA